MVCEGSSLTEKNLVTSEVERDRVDDDSRTPVRREPGQMSMLVEETVAMENARRLMEQQGHSRYAKVNQRERSDNENTNELTEGVQQEAKSHPLLAQSQRLDGIDSNLNPEPALNTDARREYDNQRREQEMEKQHRLGNMPKMGRNASPKPSPF